MVWMVVCVLAFGPLQLARVEVPREVERALRAQRPSKRRSAVKQLAQLNSRPAWLEVIDALGDPESEVADEAQLQLAGLRDERLLKELLGKRGLKHRRDLVAARVAETFGRLEVKVDGRWLERALDRRRPEVTWLALWSVERLARRGLLLEVEPLARGVRAEFARNRAGIVRATSLRARAALNDPDLASTLAGALRDADPLVRVSAVHERVLLQGAESVFAFASDKHFSVRSAVLESIGAHPTRNGLTCLVERLEREPRARLRARVVELLQQLTGMRYRTDVRPWRAYLERLDADWAPADAEVPPLRVGARSATFAGLPVLSDHVVFLVDFSGSLWHERADGRSRKSILDEKVRAALEHLPPETHFNLVPYTNAPIPWSERCVEATPKNVRSAIEFFERCKESGRGNFYGALRFALADPVVDTVIVLTDGAPTGGRHWNLDLMFDEILALNRYHTVRIDSILVDASSNLALRWKELAQATLGRSVTVELEELAGDA